MTSSAKAHHWSGWPGAICLHCLQEDAVEAGVAEDCPNCLRLNGEPPCTIHVNGECLLGFDKDCGQCKAAEEAAKEDADSAALAIKVTGLFKDIEVPLKTVADGFKNVMKLSQAAQEKLLHDIKLGSAYRQGLLDGKAIRKQIP